MKIFVKVITRENIKDAIGFILPHEQKCVNLSALLKKQEEEYLRSTPPPASMKGFIICAKPENGKISTAEGVILINNSGSLLHCIPRINSAILKAVTAVLKKNRIFGIMGEERVTSAIEKILKTEYSRILIKSDDYNLLTVKKEDFIKNKYSCYRTLENNTACKSEGIFNQFPFNFENSFVKVSAADTAKLLPLQTAYEKEEILRPGEFIPDKISRLFLERSLKTEIIFGVKSKDGFLAKAGTNAQGFFWNQIGGVYVMPEYRRLGIGTALIKTLLNYICVTENKNAALFVKKKNIAALKTYFKAGFTETCGFKIVHFSSIK